MGLGRFCVKSRDNAILLDFIRNRTRIRIMEFKKKFKLKLKLELIRKK